MPWSCYEGDFSALFLWASIEQKQILLTPQLEKAWNMPDSDGGWKDDRKLATEPRNRFRQMWGKPDYEEWKGISLESHDFFFFFK